MWEIWGDGVEIVGRCGGEIMWRQWGDSGEMWGRDHVETVGRWWGGVGRCGRSSEITWEIQ